MRRISRFCQNFFLAEHSKINHLLTTVPHYRIRPLGRRPRLDVLGIVPDPGLRNRDPMHGRAIGPAVGGGGGGGARKT